MICTARTATSKNYSTPIICLVMEGGSNTIRSVLDCLTDVPPIPVVICDGSGRAADLLAFTHKCAQDDGLVRLLKLVFEDLYGIFIFTPCEIKTLRSQGPHCLTRISYHYKWWNFYFELSSQSHYSTSNFYKHIYNI